MRFGAGVCVLSTSLLLGGTGAGIALADTPGGSSTAGAESSGGASEGGTGATSANPASATGVTVSSPAGVTATSTPSSTTATSPAGVTTGSPAVSAASTPAAITPGSIAGSITDTLRSTLRNITTTLGSGRIPGQHPSVTVNGEELLPGSGSADEDKNPGSVPAAPAGATSSPDAAPVTAPAAPQPVTANAETAAPAADPVAPAHDTVKPAAGGSIFSVNTPGGGNGDQLIGPFQDMVTTFGTTVGDAFKVIGPFQDMLVAVSNAVGLTGVIGPVQSMLATYSAMYPTAAPYITPVQNWLSWVDYAFAKPLDSELSLLFGPTWMQPRMDVAGTIDNEGLALGLDVPPAPASFPAGSQMPAEFLPTDFGGPLVGSAAGVASLGIATNHADHASALPGEVTQASLSAIPAGVQKFFRQAFRELVKSPSLAALAATALPGVAGILILTAAGVRLGYRQAKAQLALKAAGIARFAPGPIGVVRSGSFVSVAKRPTRVVRPARTVRPAPTGLATVVMLDQAA